MQTQRRVVLVTGASRGIGRAIALRLARDGFDVAATWNRDETAAKSLVAEIEADGHRCITYRADAASYDDTVALVDAVRTDFGQLDAVVSNAGIASRGNAIAETQPREIDRVMAVHALGAFYLSSLTVPLLREQERSDVVFISSVAAMSPAANGAPYMMGKAAVEALARTLAVEEATQGMRVNIVAPGLVTTAMGDRLAHAVTGAAGATDLDANWPFGRVSRPEDVADAVSFLLSAGSRQITGQRIEIHGGHPTVAG